MIELPEIFKQAEDPSLNETVLMKGKIVEAIYYPKEEYIGLKLKMEDGSHRSTWLHKSNFTFRGLPYKQVSKQESDREMAKTSELFKRAAGKMIKVRMFRGQADLG